MAEGAARRARRAGRQGGGARRGAGGRRRGVVGAVVRALDQAGIGVDDVVLRPTTLDEAYLRITGADERTEVPA